MCTRTGFVFSKKDEMEHRRPSKSAAVAEEQQQQHPQIVEVVRNSYAIRIESFIFIGFLIFTFQSDPRSSTRHPPAPPPSSSAPGGGPPRFVAVSILEDAQVRVRPRLSRPTHSDFPNRN